MTMSAGSSTDFLTAATVCAPSRESTAHTSPATRPISSFEICEDARDAGALVAVADEFSSATPALRLDALADFCFAVLAGLPLATAVLPPPDEPWCKSRFRI